jgi:hypothetical protein
LFDEAGFEQTRNQMGMVLLLKDLQNLSSNNDVYRDKRNDYEMSDLIWNQLLVGHLPSVDVKVLPKELQEAEVEADATGAFPKDKVEQRQRLFFEEQCLVGLRQIVRMLRQRTICRSGTFDLNPGPGEPAVFQRQDGIGRRLIGKGRRVRSVIPAWRGQRTATNQNGRRPSWTAWCALSLTATAAVMPKTNLCTGPLSWQLLATRFRRSSRRCLNVS